MKGRLTFVIGCVLVGAVLVVAAVSLVWPPYDPADTTGGRLVPPGGAHLLGTDKLGRGLDRRSALLIALSVFVAGNAITALGTSYEVVMIARIVTAIGAGIITSAASSTAAAIAPPDRRGRALAFVLGGLTLATALGLPPRHPDRPHRLAHHSVGRRRDRSRGGPRNRHRPTQREAPRRLVERPAAPAQAGPGPRASGCHHAGLPRGLHPLHLHRPGPPGGDRRLRVAAHGHSAGLGNRHAGRKYYRRTAGRPAQPRACADRDPPHRRRYPGPHPRGDRRPGVGSDLGCDRGRHRRTPAAPAHRPQPGSGPVLLGLNSSAIYLGVALGGGLGGLAQEWLALAPAMLGLPAAGITILALLYHLTTARRHTPAAPLPTPSTPDRART